MKSSRVAIPWFVWALLAMAAYVGMAWIGPWSEHLGGFLLLYAAAWGATWGVSRSRLGLAPLLVLALAFRALLVPLEPSLSDDLYRYVWEGRIQAAGHNPFLLAPSAPALEELRDPLWQSINNPDASAIYPPLAQIVFRGLASLGGITVFKAALAGVDVLLIVLIGLTLRRRQLPVARLALYAWNPLVIVETAGSGHLEPLAILPLVLATVVARQRAVLAWVALAASIGIKYAGALLIPALATVARPGLRALVAAAACLVLVTLPYLDAGVRLFDSLLLYADKWRYNDMLFGILQRLIGSLWWSKAAAGALLLAVIAFVLGRRSTLEHQAMTVLGALVLLSPTIHPWYLLWVIAFLPFAASYALFAWSGTIVLAYLFLYPAFGFEPFEPHSVTLRVVQMLPVAIGAGLDWRSRRGTATPPGQ